MFFLLDKEDWGAAVPLLAKGREGPVRKAATLDAARPRDSEGRRAVGDAWWDAGRSVRFHHEIDDNLVDANHDRRYKGSQVYGERRFSYIRGEGLMHARVGSDSA